jgi:hypothetical protein
MRNRATPHKHPYVGVAKTIIAPGWNRTNRKQMSLIFKKHLMLKKEE